MSLDWVQKILRERLGFRPYPATLNLWLESEKESARWREIRAAQGLNILPPGESFCAARSWRVAVMKANDERGVKVEGAVIFPEVENYPADKVEIIAPVNLKEALDVSDGERLTLEFL